jgi:ribosome maturation protein SDO1
MVNTEARIKINNKHFEILVDLDKALAFKKGENVVPSEFLVVNEVFSDTKKGLRVAEKDLKDAFGSTDIYAIAERIVKNGEVLLPAEYKKQEQETRRKQIIEFLVKNSIDTATKRPFTPQVIEEALDKSGANIDKKSVEEQIPRILEGLKKIIPIKVESKKIKLTIPAVYTGRAYGLIQSYKEKEEWLSNGDLSCIINLPVGLQMEFYDKLNAITHGSAIAEDLKE